MISHKLRDSRRQFDPVVREPNLRACVRKVEIVDGHAHDAGDGLAEDQQQKCSEAMRGWMRSVIQDASDHFDALELVNSANRFHGSARNDERTR